MPTPEPPGLTFAFEARVDVGTPVTIGETPAGTRRIVPILGGSFEGPHLRGIVHAGADWQVLRRDGVSDIEARYLLETDAGALVTVVNRGLRHAPSGVMVRLNAGEAVDPSLVYFRTVATFETAEPALAWLTRSVVVGTGARHPAQVVIQFWTVT
ncbi:MAG: DUF3237 domain-containing protein [Proteobacteria bacterium]|jgi:hypothetical protein|nr:DUF3237 domain-containing protein [Pseudomonadota bacterium]NBY47857.1 DUF3237 domain-containing protein [Pseudomonadota bacterium]NCV22327.1 DUF3237 domain-containing protein [Chloroflexota bacterium]NDB73863.1 DUF3237 domain-containing protein [Pseudomonadota bacterium]NDF09008.1 DUF3237 domain-containing protein [Pseudomonadota bacterium]